MILDYQYTYFVGNLIILLVWLVLFLFRKDTRREMLTLSILFGFIGLFVENIYVVDWWRPLTITNTLIGIEDFLFGFSSAGIAAVVYTIILKKRLFPKHSKKEKKSFLKDYHLLLMMAFLFTICFYLLRLNSFISTIIAFLVPISIIWIKRTDLIKDSIITGIILTLMSILGYSLLNFLSPGFIEEFWLFENIGHTIILGTPLEEIIWYFLAGLFLGPLYEYHTKSKLKDLNK